MSQLCQVLPISGEPELVFWKTRTYALSPGFGKRMPCSDTGRAPASVPGHPELLFPHWMTWAKRPHFSNLSFFTYKGVVRKIPEIKS